MLQSFRTITERFYQTVGGTKVYKNPSASEFDVILKNSYSRSLRLLKNGGIWYVWDAYKCDHYGMVQQLGLDEWDWAEYDGDPYNEMQISNSTLKNDPLLLRMLKHQKNLKWT